MSKWIKTLVVMMVFGLTSQLSFAGNSCRQISAGKQKVIVSDASSSSSAKAVGTTHSSKAKKAQ